MGDYRESHVAPEAGRTYDRIYEGPSRGADAFYWEYFEKPLVKSIFRELSGRGGRYLDFAAGTGRISELAIPYFPTPVCVDVSEEMLAEARRKMPGAEFHLADITARPLDLGRFDVISLFRFVLNAEAELRDTVLRWLRSAIDPRGHLLLNNHMNTLSISAVVTLVAQRVAGRRVNVLSEREVKRLLHHSGFEVVASYGFRLLPSWRGHLILPPGVLLPVERTLCGIHGLQRFGKDRIYLCRPI